MGKTLSEYVQERTTDQLEDELEQLNFSIDDVDCFGINDLLLRDSIEVELDRREN